MWVLAFNAEECLLNFIGSDLVALPKVVDVIIIPYKNDARWHRVMLHCSTLYYI
jgi:hypothetical protein